MNTATATIAGVVVLLILFFGGLFLYNQGNDVSTTATSTPTGAAGGTTPTGAGQTQTAGSPTAVTLATVTPSNTGAAVVGTVVPNGAFTTYWFEYGTTANLGSATAHQSIGSGFESLAAPYYMTGLVKDTTYYFRLVAQNKFGNSTGDTFTFRTTVGPVVITGSVPSVQTSAANSVTALAATVNGKVTPNKSPTTYWFEYGKTKDLGFVTAAQSVGDGSATLPAAATLQSLEPGITYYFRLNAQNAFGTVEGAILNFKTAGQAAVAVPVVTTQLASPFATTTATLRGTVNPYGGQTTYWFEYSTDAGLVADVKTTQRKSVGAGLATVSIEQAVSGLKSATTYYYRTVAQNNGGTVRGNVQTVKTK